MKTKIVAAGALAVALAIRGVATAKPVQEQQQARQSKPESHAGYCTTTCSGYGGYRTCNTYCY